MQQLLDTPEEFSFVKRTKSFSYAGRGLYVFIKTTHNAWIHILISIVTIVLGLYLGISKIEWILLIILFGFVFVSEAFNTAIEIDINLTSPQFHPYAKDTKDVAAGAVLISVITAITVGLFIFVPYLL